MLHVITFKDGPLKGTSLGVTKATKKYTHKAADGATYTYNKRGKVVESTPAPEIPTAAPAGGGVSEEDRAAADTAIDALTKVCLAIGFDPRNKTREELEAAIKETGTLIDNMQILSRNLLHLLRQVARDVPLPDSAVPELKKLGQRLKAIENMSGTG